MDFRHPSWSPDGKQLVVDAGNSGVREVYTVDVDSGQTKQVTQLGTNISFPSWSPDGKMISFYVYKEGELALWTVGADGSGPRELVPGIASERKQQCTFACHAAAWSPDSQRLAVATNGQAQVWTVRAADGTDMRRVSPDGLNSHFPMYLADGQLLYVVEHVTPGHSWTDVWSVKPGINDTPDLVLGDIQAQGPFEFSADGQQLLFSSPRSGSFDVYLVTLTDEGKEALKTKSGETQPAPGMHPANVQGGTQPAPNVPGAPIVPGAPAAASAPSAAAASPANQSDESFFGGDARIYLGALGAVALIWLGVEASAWRRRRRTRDQ
jgi:Tol biopolymer transport system component